LPMQAVKAAAAEADAVMLEVLRDIFGLSQDQKMEDPSEKAEKDEEPAVLGGRKAR